MICILLIANRESQRCPAARNLVPEAGIVERRMCGCPTAPTDGTRDPLATF
jgi:hypothetical protein